MIYILDAHAIIWHLDDHPHLGPAAAAVMDDPLAHVVVPTIALAEIHHLHGRGRIRVSLARARSMLASMPNAVTHPLDDAVLTRLPAGMEMHDAIIVATALVYRDRGAEPVRLLTRDRQITASGLVDVLW